MRNRAPQLAGLHRVTGLCIQEREDAQLDPQPVTIILPFYSRCGIPALLGRVKRAPCASEVSWRFVSTWRAKISTHPRCAAPASSQPRERETVAFQCALNRDSAA